MLIWSNRRGILQILSTAKKSLALSAMNYFRPTLNMFSSIWQCRIKSPRALVIGLSFSHRLDVLLNPHGEVLERPGVEGDVVVGDDIISAGTAASKIIILYSRNRTQRDFEGGPIVCTSCRNSLPGVQMTQ